MLKFEQLSIKNSSKSNQTFLDKKQKIFQKLTKVFFRASASWKRFPFFFRRAKKFRRGPKKVSEAPKSRNNSETNVTSPSQEDTGKVKKWNPGKSGGRTREDVGGYKSGSTSPFLSQSR